jgi:hypothetical protein
VQQNFYFFLKWYCGMFFCFLWSGGKVSGVVWCGVVVAGKGFGERDGGTRDVWVES